MRRSFRTRSCFAGWVPRVGTLGWYAMPRQGMGFETGLGHGIGNGSTLRENGIEPDKKRSARRSAPRPGSATPATENPNLKPPSKRPSRRCSRGRRPRFPHLAPRPHRSNAGSETPSFPLPQRGNAYQPRASALGTTSQRIGVF